MARQKAFKWDKFFDGLTVNYAHTCLITSQKRLIDSKNRAYVTLVGEQVYRTFTENPYQEYLREIDGKIYAREFEFKATRYLWAKNGYYMPIDVMAKTRTNCSRFKKFSLASAGCKDMATVNIELDFTFLFPEDLKTKLDSIAYNEKIEDEFALEIANYKVKNRSYTYYYFDIDLNKKQDEAYFERIGEHVAKAFDYFVNPAAKEAFALMGLYPYMRGFQLGYQMKAER